jgi:gluconolactonase
LFSDIPANTVCGWSEDEETQVFLQPVTPENSDTGAVGGSNGLTLDTQGKLVLCEHGNQRVARLENDGSRTTLADRSDVKRRRISLPFKLDAGRFKTRRHAA